jgi:hypothetical protein
MKWVEITAIVNLLHVFLNTIPTVNISNKTFIFCKKNGLTIKTRNNI